MHDVAKFSVVERIAADTQESGSMSAYWIASLD